MRLIDADELTRKIEKSYLTSGEKRLFIVKVRHMPTVDINDNKYLEERDADAYETGYLQGHVDGYLKAEKNYATPLGEWLKIDEDWFDIKCSICGIKMVRNFNFCPNCGAKMKVGENNV